MADVSSFRGHHGLFNSIWSSGLRPDHPPFALPTKTCRAPLQVMYGNYQRMHGVCPWWDSLSRQA
jgi:hypothetical protein